LPNVLNYEPHLALFVEDDDPLLFYKVISVKARQYLTEQGWLFFEINPDFADDLCILMGDLGFVNITLMKDLQGKYRMLKGQNP
jgi:release factor glutamine methyltransferase